MKSKILQKWNKILSVFSTRVPNTPYLQKVIFICEDPRSFINGGQERNNRSPSAPKIHLISCYQVYISYIYILALHYSFMIILLHYNVQSCVVAVIIQFFQREMTESLLFDNGALEESIYTLPNENLVRKRCLRAHSESVHRIIIPILASVIIIKINVMMITTVVTLL